MVGQKNMELCLSELESILNYQFRNRKILEEALTHSSFTESASYQRLEFFGDAVLGLAVAKIVYVAYPSLGPGPLTLLRAANVSTEKLARVAVHHGLFRFVRHNAAALEDLVSEFVHAVMEEKRTTIYAGAVKAPKILADIVESIAAAVYIDCEFNLKLLWEVFRVLLEPIVTLETLAEQPQPVTFLYELCQKQGKKVDIENGKKDSMTVASVYVDGKLVGTGSSIQNEIARLNAAREALKTLAQTGSLDGGVTNLTFEVDENNEIKEAKQNLYSLCGKKKWPNPIYSVEEEDGPPHDKRYVCSVRVNVEARPFVMNGDARSRLKDAENSAASSMIHSLIQSGHAQRTACKSATEHDRSLSLVSDEISCLSL